ncbi:MAG: hypothetical protein JWQ49_2276 [Edaphobacter sp.]|nr:hypothetical protein [Edaphobacter sp.]
MNLPLKHAETSFADNIMPKHQQTNVWTYNLSVGLASLAKGLQMLDAKIDLLQKAQQPPR